MNALEIAGFVTGALSVWLAVRQNPWNWPFGVAHAVWFHVLFWQARLYGDMALQVLFIAICLLGWYRWLFGGAGHSRLRVSHISTRAAVGYACLGVSATAVFTPYLRSVGDASPLLDALTTVLSVEAQYLMTRKVIENWWVWIAADIVYIWLYANRGLYLTSLLYVVFLVMCVVGLRDWLRDSAAQQAAAAA
jgi:nicotinamide mononucleotide transporter